MGTIVLASVALLFAAQAAAPATTGGEQFTVTVTVTTSDPMRVFDEGKPELESKAAKTCGIKARAAAQDEPVLTGVAMAAGGKYQATLSGTYACISK